MRELAGAGYAGAVGMAFICMPFEKLYLQGFQKSVQTGETLS